MTGLPGFLAGLTVLEFGDGVAGAGTTSLLAALGADVTAVVDPRSVHRQARPTVLVDGQQVGLLGAVLDRGKRLVTVDERDLAALVAGGAQGGGSYDLVVVDRVAGAVGPLRGLSDADTYVEAVTRINRRAWLSISAFGLSGPRRNDTGTELIVAAASGMLASVRDPATGRPLKLAGQQSLLNTAQAGALAACHVIDLAREGAAAHLDLSAVEATIATGPTLALCSVLLSSGTNQGGKRYGAPASFYACRDGMIRISAMEDHQWQGVVSAMGEPAWTEQFATVDARINDPDTIDAQIGRWTGGLTKEQAETLLQSHGVPATAMYSPAETLRSPQLAHRESFGSVRLADGRDAQVVDHQFRIIDRAGEPGTPRARSLQGLKVLEVSHVLAAPLAGAMLGAIGAEVTKLEDLKRIDMYRRRGPYIDEMPGGERSAYFALVNHSKRSIAFDAEGETTQLTALLDAADVVVENVGGRRAARLGILASELIATRPDVLGVSSSGYGQSGPFASYRAYAYNLQASCCLGYLTRNESDEFSEIDLPWADLVSGFALATIVAAWAVGPRGNAGAGIDFAMADLIIGHFNEFIAAASLDPDSDASVDRGNELTPLSPHGTYPSADGWIAIAVSNDQQFAALVKVLGADALRASDFADVPSRLANRRTLDQLVAEATRHFAAAALCHELTAAGVAAEVVVSPVELPNVPWLVDRGFFAEVDHPEWGRRRLIGIPWRPCGGPAIPLTAPPLLDSSVSVGHV